VQDQREAPSIIPLARPRSHTRVGPISARNSAYQPAGALSYSEISIASSCETQPRPAYQRLRPNDLKNLPIPKETSDIAVRRTSGRRSSAEPRPGSSVAARPAVVARSWISASSPAFDLNGQTKARTNQRSSITRSAYPIRSPSRATGLRVFDTDSSWACSSA
jgi:hypothetical protein